MDISHEDMIKIFQRNNLSTEFTIKFNQALYEFGDSFKIDSDLRTVRFLTQSKHETLFRSDGSPRLRESMWYKDSTLKRLSKYFRKNQLHRKSLTSNISNIKSRMEIANYWYGNRMGNGGPRTGDGWKYRGAGMLQSTGKDTIRKDAIVVYDMTGYDVFDENDELKDTYETFIYLGMAYWFRNKCYECNGTNCVTNIINPGLPKRYKMERLNTAIRIQEILS